MVHNFFLSHYNGDKDAAQLIANMLRRITLQQINPWFSSDGSEIGGLKPGNIWFSEILNKITQSNAVVIILTPNSIDRPWIYFESGIAQALPNCEVIPICIGVNRDTLKAPLNLYQCYQTTDYKSIKEFTAKLLEKFSISFDEEMSKPILEKTIKELAKIKFVKSEETTTVPTSESLLENLKSHIDKRFIELISTNAISSVITNGERLDNLAKDNPLFSITLSFNFPNLQKKDIFLDIRETDTFQDITDTIYYQLDSKVNAFTYLEEWLIVEAKSQQHLIIREIGRRIPAKSLFIPNGKYIVTKLNEPYNALSSGERIRNSIS
jgi:TIR domain